MNTIATLFLLAFFLPVVAAGIAKAGGQGFDNASPRDWLSQQKGYRARANAAQKNIFEGLPFFFAAALFALHNQVDLGDLRNMMAAWIILRLVYVGCYVANVSLLRTAVWSLSVAVNIYMLYMAI